MQLALVDGLRLEAFSGGRGLCPICGSEVIAKCGPRIMHHWAHYRPKECDPWWENETPWHRDWKNLFPIECLEVSHTAHDGEIHRADIKTPTGIIVEVQHSSMTDAERQSRELFYGNLAWILDGSKFTNNFDIYHRLPHPTSETARDLVWAKARRHMNGANSGIFFLFSEPKWIVRVSLRQKYAAGGYIRSRRYNSRSISRTVGTINSIGYALERRGWNLNPRCILTSEMTFL